MTEHEKPTLEAVLDHYGAAYSPSRLGHQMVSCVLHEDQTPSMSVNLGKQLWRCFSCGEGGDSYTLIEKKEGVDFVGATEFASTLGLATTNADGGDEPVRTGWAKPRRGSSDRKGYQPRYRARFQGGGG